MLSYSIISHYLTRFETCNTEYIRKGFFTGETTEYFDNPLYFKSMDLALLVIKNEQQHIDSVVIQAYFSKPSNQIIITTKPTFVLIMLWTPTNHLHFISCNHVLRIVLAISVYLNWVSLFIGENYAIYSSSLMYSTIKFPNSRLCTAGVR